MNIMKAVFTRHRIQACLLAALLMLTTILPVAALDPGELDAKSALLMEAETGEVLYEKNADESLQHITRGQCVGERKSCRNGRISGLSLFGRADERRNTY